MAVNIAVVRQLGSQWTVLMAQRNSHVTHPLAWGLITGTREQGESLIQTAYRELAEELSLTPLSLWATEHLISFFVPSIDAIWHAPVFVAITDQVDFTVSHEIAAYEWMSGSDASARARWKSLKKFLPELFEELTRFPDATWQQLGQT